MSEAILPEHLKELVDGEKECDSTTSHLKDHSSSQESGGAMVIKPLKHVPDKQTKSAAQKHMPNLQVKKKFKVRPHGEEGAGSGDAEIEKTHHFCITRDGWRMHMVRSRLREGVTVKMHGNQESNGDAACHLPHMPPHWSQHPRAPVLLVPGLGSSGVHTFDLSPEVSFVDYLARRGWDVWTCELRGNGRSSRPRWGNPLRSRLWTVDHNVLLDLPAILTFVTAHSHNDKVHVMGHSMGGMILTKLLGSRIPASNHVLSATILGSGCFLEHSWWRTMEAVMPLVGLLWAVPAGTFLGAYSHVALTKLAIPMVDHMYFWPANVDPELGRAVLRHNFSNISVGVIKQFQSSFGELGLRTADGRGFYADPSELRQVETPVMVLVGDKDRMCPPDAARSTFDLFGSPCKHFVCAGPAAGHSSHYGHFDILMGLQAEKEVFPILEKWLEEVEEQTRSLHEPPSTAPTAVAPFVNWDPKGLKIALWPGTPPSPIAPSFVQLPQSRL